MTSLDKPEDAPRISDGMTTFRDLRTNGRFGDRFLSFHPHGDDRKWSVYAQINIFFTTDCH